MSLYGRDVDGNYHQNGIFWNPKIANLITRTFAQKFGFAQKVSAPAQPTSGQFKVIHLSNGSRAILNSDTSVIAADGRTVKGGDIRPGLNLLRKNSTLANSYKANNIADLRSGRYDLRFPLLSMAALLPESAMTARSTLNTAFESGLFYEHNRSLSSPIIDAPRPAADVNLNSVNYNLLTIHRSGTVGPLQNIAIETRRGIDFRRIIGHDLFAITDLAVDSYRNYIVAYNMGLRAGADDSSREVLANRVNDMFILPNLTIQNGRYTMPNYDYLGERESVLSRTPLLSPNEAGIIVIPFLAGFIDALGSIDSQNFLTLRFSDRRKLRDILDLLVHLSVNYQIAPVPQGANQTLLYSFTTQQHTPYSVIIDSFGISRLLSLGVQSKLLNEIGDDLVVRRTFFDSPLIVLKTNLETTLSDVYVLNENDTPDSYFDDKTSRLALEWQEMFILPTTD